MQTREHWVGTWAAAPAPAEGVVGFNNHTIRMNPRISIGGERLRVRISNAYGNRPLTIGAGRIGLRDKGPAIITGSERKLTFGGSEAAVIAAGAVLYSDTVEMLPSVNESPSATTPPTPSGATTSTPHRKNHWSVRLPTGMTLASAKFPAGEM